MKNLICFAHRNEAQAFLQSQDLRPVPTTMAPLSQLFMDSQNYLLITGEGLIQAMQKSLICLTHLKDKVASLINFGVAGSLSDELKIGKIYSIRTVYGESTQQMHFQSFSSLERESTYDCISAEQRVLKANKKGELSCFADIVDRELWGLAYSAHLFKIPFSSYKLVTDHASEQTNCTEIQNQAKKWSQNLYTYFQQNIISEKRIFPRPKEKINLPTGFYFTITQRRLVINYLKKLAILEKIPIENLLDNFFLDTLEQIKMKISHPKKRTQKLIEKLQSLLNPISSLWLEDLNKILAPLRKAGIEIQISETQNAKTEFKFNIDSLDHYKKMKNAFRDFPYHQLHDHIHAKNSLGSGNVS